MVHLLTMPPAFSLFAQEALDNPVFFFSVVITVVVSVTLHELGHGYAALSQGDDTPRVLGHMTLDPLKHMGLTSLIALVVIGFAWGAMPVNPSRFRSRHGDALVAFAGPAVNLLLAALGLTILGLWMRLGGPVEEGAALNLREFLFVFGMWNILLFLFNLLPIPPLDGSTVVASFVPPYARFIQNPDNQGVFFAAFIAILVFASPLWDAAETVAVTWMRVVGGLG